MAPRRRPAGHGARPASNVKSGEGGQRRVDAPRPARAAARPAAADAGGQGPRGAVGVAAHGAPLAGTTSSAPTSTGSRSGTTWGGGRRAGLLRSTGPHALGGAGRAPRRHRPLPGPGGPVADPGGGAAAMRSVLERMLRAGRADREQARSRRRRTLDLVPPSSRAFEAPHLVSDLAGWLRRSGSATRWRSGPRSTRRSSATSSGRCARSSPPPAPRSRRRCSSSTTPRATFWPMSAPRTSETTPTRARTTGSALAASRAARSSPSPTASRSRAAGPRPRC